MNTFPSKQNLISVIDSSGNIGEIILRPEFVVGNPNGMPGLNHAGQWLLFVGPNTIKYLMTSIIVGLAEHEEVRLLDCGNQYDSSLANRLAKGNLAALERIKVKQAQSCEDALYLLDHTSMSPVPFLALDLLRPFYDSQDELAKRKEMLVGCMQNLRRLSMNASGMVSICPHNGSHDQQTKELFRTVEKEAESTFDVSLYFP